MKIDVTVISAPRKRKPISEDVHAIIQEPGLPFFATIVDGHGPGDELNPETVEFSVFVLEQLMQQFRLHPSAKELPHVFDIVQAAVEARYEDLPFGAVVTCIVIDDDGLTIAQAGDCRVYQFLSSSRRGCAMLTQDHCTENATEMVRLRPFYDSGKFRPIDHDGGGHWMEVSEFRLHFKKPDGTWSSNGLMPTRGFGDPEFRPAFTHVPEIRFIALDPSEPTLIAFTSDGGSRTAVKAFQNMRQKNVRDFPSIIAEVVSSVPKEPPDDLTILLLSLSPVAHM